MGIVLYANAQWTSPYVLSAFVALREKGLAFDTKTVSLQAGEQHAPDFVARSLTSRVPVLVDGDFTLSESSAIVEYLDDAFPPPRYPRVLPEGLHERARARQVMAWIRSDHMPIREERSSEYVFYPLDEVGPPPPLSPAAVKAVARLFAAAERLVPADAGPLFGAWCAADTDLALMLQRLVKTRHDVPERLRRYADAQWQRPFVQEFVSRKRPPLRS